MESKFDAVIIGGGACGLMCAVQAGFLGKKTLLIEHNTKVGAKILISGGGRCNYTNLHTSSQQFISENEHFCKSALAQWTVHDTISFFETYGIYGKEKTLGQLFPTTNKAKDVIEVFTNLCDDLEQKIQCNTSVEFIKKLDNGFEIKMISAGNTNIIECNSVVIATGGLPIPKMGATDFAFQIAKQFDIKLTKIAPALVPLTIGHTYREWYQKLSGTSIFARVWNNRASFEENILFTHWGLSGPAILQISSYWKPGEDIFMDLLPNRDIIDLITKEREQSGKMLLSNFLGRFYSKRFVDASQKYLPTQKQLANLTANDLILIHQFIHQFTVKPAGDKGYDKAEVMRGGISTDEISSKTLESKKVPGLFFGGECVDVTGWLGGYNFQWAWASGYVIAQNI